MPYSRSILARAGKEKAADASIDGPAFIKNEFSE